MEEADKEREQLVASHAAGLEQLLALQADRLQSRQQAFLAELQVCQSLQLNMLELNEAVIGKSPTQASPTNRLLAAPDLVVSRWDFVFKRLASLWVSSPSFTLSCPPPAGHAFHI